MLQTLLLIVHLLIAVALVGTVLLQRSEGGALGIGGGGGLMTGRGAANFLTRTTAILAAAFFVTSIGLAYLAGNHRQPTSIIDSTAPASEAPAKPAAPAAPAGPTVPQSK